MADDDTGYINPVTGDPVTTSYVNALKAMGTGIVNHLSTPGAAMQPNPYPEGTEQYLEFENSRNAAMANWAPAQAAAMIGGGSPFAEAGAVGAAGGRLAAVRNPITGKLQVAPTQALTDAFVAGGPPVEVTPYVPARANGRFANTRDAGRAAVLTPDKVTAPDVLRQPNVMYDPANPPAPVVSRLEVAPAADPAAVERNLSKLPNVFGPTEQHILKTYGLAGLSMLPPATAAFLGARLTPVDHDPFSGGS